MASDVQLKVRLRIFRDSLFRIQLFAIQIAHSFRRLGFGQIGHRLGLTMSKTIGFSLLGFFVPRFLFAVLA